jgi:hypothetical protein
MIFMRALAANLHKLAHLNDKAPSVSTVCLGHTGGIADGHIGTDADVALNDRPLDLRVLADACAQQSEHVMTADESVLKGLEKGVSRAAAT